MCFSIPLKVLKRENSLVTVEGGKKIFLGKNLKIKKGDYLQVNGSMAVSRISSKEGLKIRKLIKNLYYND